MNLPNVPQAIFGALFGLFLGGGLIYFETFDYGTHPIYYFISFVIPLSLFGGTAHVLRASNDFLSIRNLLYWSVTFIILGLILFLITMMVQEKGGTMEQFSRIFIHLSLSGLLPGFVILWVLQNEKNRGKGTPPTGDGSAVEETLELKPNSGDKIEFTLASLVLIEAANNYCNFYIRQEHQVIKKMIRITMKEVGEALKSYPNIIRCHRSYFVNKDYVDKLSGSTQSNKLQILGLDILVPVSRNFDTRVLKK